MSTLIIKGGHSISTLIIKGGHSVSTLIIKGGNSTSLPIAISIGTGCKSLSTPIVFKAGVGMILPLHTVYLLFIKHQSLHLLSERGSLVSTPRLTGM